MSAAIFTGMLIYGFFENDFSTKEAIIRLFFKSFLTAIITGAILGVLNIIFKIDNFKK
jgi:hypothetical protein